MPTLLMMLKLRSLSEVSSGRLVRVHGATHATVEPMLIKLMRALKTKEKMMLFTGRWRRGWTCRYVSCSADVYTNMNSMYMREKATERKSFVAGESEELSRGCRHHRGCTEDDHNDDNRRHRIGALPACRVVEDL